MQDRVTRSPMDDLDYDNHIVKFFNSAEGLKPERAATKRAGALDHQKE